MSDQILQRPKRNLLTKSALVVLLIAVMLVGGFLINTQYSMNLAKDFVSIPADASNRSALYLGIGQSRTIYVRFDLAVETGDEFLSELCGDRYTDIDNQTNPFQGIKPQWWLPNWWSPPQNSEIYLGGECYNRTMYRVLIDMTNEARHTAYIMVNL